MLGLRKRADYWRTRLNITEWTITVKWLSAQKTGGDEGKVDFCTEYLTATVYIARKCREKEATLVHELLHIVIEGDKQEELKYDVHLERAINRIAAALTTSDTERQ